ncbi:hypothetical protein OUZ56_003562 [Daphnia magna]|uniref:Uncharacterized protein n=1 Tax=Daphnia magna TaxID=35525 RepID=A0ABR0A968_9CRUS|nr:hypothetical protein OUZ56_003562 [Daphnia magna]
MENSSACGNVSQAAFHPVLGMDKVIIAVRKTHKVDHPDGESNQTDATGFCDGHLQPPGSRDPQPAMRKSQGSLSRRHNDGPVGQLACSFASGPSAMHETTRGGGLRCSVAMFPTKCHLRNGLHTVWGPTQSWKSNHRRGRMGAHVVFRVLLARKLRQLQRKGPTFKNNTWTPVSPNLATHGRRLIDAEPLEIDNSLGMILQLNQNNLTPLRRLQNYGRYTGVYPDGLYHRNVRERHVDTVLVHPWQAEEISFMARVGYWLRNFSILSGVGVSIVLAFRLCGLGSLLGLYIPCCRYFNPCSGLAPPQSLRCDIELGLQVNPGPVPSAPVTIVNIPTPPTPTGANIAVRPAMTHQPPPAAYSLRWKPKSFF